MTSQSRMLVSSPSLPPSSPTSSPVKTIPPDDEQLELRLHVFSKCKALMNQANERGYILNWENRIAKSPVPWHWPLDEDGKRFPTAMLNYAYMHYEFSPPCCPCNTQELNSNVYHYAKIWVVRNPDSKFCNTVALGCRSHYHGCAIFVSMVEMEDHPDLLTQKYLRRRLPRKGLIGFDPVGKLSASQKTLPTPPLSVSTPITPSPPSRFITQSRSCGFSIGRGKKRTSPSTLSLLLSSPKKAKQLSTGHHYDSEDDEDSEDNAILTFPASAQPPLKRCSSSPIYISDSEDSVSSVKIKEEHTESDMTRTASCTLLPSERFFGDTDAIFSPPDINYALRKNSEVPPLSEAELAAALTGLQSGQGIKSETLWRMYDKCDCSAWVRKDMMNIHNKKYCVLSPQPNTPFNSSSTAASSTLSPKTPGSASLSNVYTATGRYSPRKATEHHDTDATHFPFSSPATMRSSKSRGYDHSTFSQEHRMLSPLPVPPGRSAPYTLPSISSGLSAPFTIYDVPHYRYAGSSKNTDQLSYHPSLNLNATSAGQALMNFTDVPTYFDNSSANSSVNSPASYFPSGPESQY